MKTSAKFACRVAEAYLLDQQAQGLMIPTEILNNLMGSLRARNISSLATASQQLGHEYQAEPLFFVLRQFEAFFKKNDAFVTSNCDSAALNAFLRYERRCKITNRRIAFYDAHPERLPPDHRRYIKRMQHFISEVLGTFNDKEDGLPIGFLNDLPQYIKLTNGATRDSNRADSQIWRKLSRSPQGPLRAKPYIEALLRYHGFENMPDYRVTPFNRVAIVPKNWKTGRTIGMEATAAMPLQLAFDTYVKTRLRMGILGCNIDLADQSSNQLAAFVGSLDGSIATIDLEGASDCLSYNVASLLLPAEWFRYLNDIRSRFWLFEKTAKSPRRYGKFEKLSSMGNGSTFPVETLIFSAACYAVGSSKYRVYGDDIAVETEYASSVISLLRYLGFRTNLDKTFTVGFFRESCGADYIKGRDVTPFYLRESVSEKFNDIQKRYNTTVNRYIKQYRSLRNLKYAVKLGKLKLTADEARLILRGPQVPLLDKAIWSHQVNGLLKLNDGYVGKLLTLCCETIDEQALPLVPYNGNSQSGVWIHSYYAHKLGILKYAQDKQQSKTSYQDLTYYSIHVEPKRLTVNRGYGVYWSWFLLKSENVLDRYTVLPRTWKILDANILQTARIATVVDDPNKLSARMGSSSWVPNPQDDYTERLFAVSESLLAAKAAKV